jgi:hypothetical protein
MGIVRALAGLFFAASLVVSLLATGAMATTITYGTSSSSSSFESAGTGAKKSTGPSEKKTASVNTTALVPVTRTFLVRFRGLIFPVTHTFFLPVTRTTTEPAP